MGHQEEISLVFNMLPASVQSRIQYFNSLRRPASISLSLAPRPSAKEGLDDFAAASSDDAKQDVTPVEARVKAATLRRQEILTASGVRWRYAEQGTNMHRIAYLEKEDPAFSRKSYIDGVAYILTALPDNLSDQEIAVIREALPPSSFRDIYPVGGRDDRAIEWTPPPQGVRTLLQRCIAGLVALFVVLMHLVLSYAEGLVRAGMQYEREHSVSQQLASRVFVLAAAFGRHSVVLSAKIYAMSDGRVGKAMGNLAAWTAETVSYGVQDGIGQGLMMIDTKLPPSSPRLIGY